MDNCWVCVNKKGSYRERFEKALCDDCFKGLIRLEEYQAKIAKEAQGKYNPKVQSEKSPQWLKVAHEQTRKKLAPMTEAIKKAIFR